MTIDLTWAGVTGFFTALYTAFKLFVEIRRQWKADRRDMHQLADILRRDIYLTQNESEPNRDQKLMSLLREVNPIRDRLWETRGRPRRTL
jgi:hypothetical protein